jgi:ubiquinone/menaquinone biosynthesis C-methylase UbiE
MLRYKIYSKLLITKGDFIELYQKIRSYGFGNIAGRFLLPGSKRVKAKWNNEEEISDFWIIPEVRERWNDKSTGDKKQGIEAYFVSKYLNDRRGLKMLSIGCGTGAKERRFGKHVNFEVIEGIDVAENQIEKAQKYAAETGMKNLQYVCGDFVSRDYEKESFDVIHFNSSLHHFENVEALLKEKVRPLLKPDGYLVLFEYVGPSRLQWGKEQLEFVNRTLKEIPEKYR